jgi:hypothetical protein
MRETISKILVEDVIPALGALLAALIPVVVFKINAFVAAKTKNEQIRGIVERMTTAAADVVRDVSAVELKALKANAADGKLDTSDRMQLRDLAIGRLKAHLGAVGVADARGALKLSISEFETVLRGKIESAVDEMNLARMAAANAVPVAPVAGG